MQLITLGESSMISIQNQKKAARVHASAIRRQAFKTKAQDAALAILPHASALWRPGLTVGLFAAIRDEISLWPLMNAAHEFGCTLALPVVMAPETPLLFRAWTLGQPLEVGSFSVQVPPETAPQTLPDLVFVPGLAFDAQGLRLGYGGGFYDRTFANWKAQGHRFQAIGVGFDEQRVEDVPHEATDMPLNGLLTPLGLTVFTPGF